MNNELTYSLMTARIFVVGVDCCAPPDRYLDDGDRRRQCTPFVRGYLPVDVDDLVPRESGTAPAL